MKKIFVTIIFLSLVLGGYAQSYNNNSTQEDLRAGISNYLHQQGLNPEKQDDGLKFKSEGSTYYIEIDKEAQKPMYVRLRRYVKYNDKCTKESVFKNLNKYNVKFGVKVLCQEKSYVLSSEMFLTQASEFGYVFNRFLSQMKSAYKLITE